MAAITGITGAVTSWTNNTQLISTGSKPMQFSLDVDCDEHDVTAFDTTGAQAYIKGLRSWGGSFTAQLATPAIGALGLVTFSAGYVVNLNAFSVNIACAEHEVTAFAATEKAYIPGMFNWSGTFGGFLDGTTAATLPGNSNEPATGTFLYQELGATDNTLAGSIFTTRLGIGVSPTAPNSVNYSFRGSGALTQSSTSVGIIPDGALAVPTVGELVLTASTGRTFTGNAFWTGIAIAVSVGAPTVLTGTFRGTGALTPA